MTKFVPWHCCCGERHIPWLSAAGIEATIGAHANDPKAALTFVKFLQGPEIDAGLKANMMVKAK